MSDSYIEELLLNFTSLTMLKSTEADSTRCSQEIMSWGYFAETSVTSIKLISLLLKRAIIETGIKDA
jgi:hypothetical protein